jgi:hypothetical protein
VGPEARNADDDNLQIAALEMIATFLREEFKTNSRAFNPKTGRFDTVSNLGGHGSQPDSAERSSAHLGNSTQPLRPQSRSAGGQAMNDDELEDQEQGEDDDDFSDLNDLDEDFDEYEYDLDEL